LGLTANGETPFDIDLDTMISSKRGKKQKKTSRKEEELSGWQ
jgi:hypothetical protein